jgi:radical SAM family uncharacterized protein/radical SAM-linked protein
MHVYQDEWFSNIIHPSRYLGDEVNSIQKDPSAVEISMALAFPDVYEIGMSHLGLKILYHILNLKNWLSAERIFAPWIDLGSECKKRGIPLTSLETGKPLSEFDIIGFSLQHELCYTNILYMLDLGNIPLLSQERESTDPLVIAGGPACFNPEPVADLFDAIVIGDGEEAALSICQTVREWKLDGRKSRAELLKELAKVKGIYIPSFFQVHYNTKGIIQDIEPLIKGHEGVEKAIVSDLNCYPFPAKQIIPFTELVHDRFTIEIARGCSRGCRFCQAGMIYRPVRERDPREIVAIAERGLHETGFEDLSLLSLSSGDYSCILPLVHALVRKMAEKHVAISFSSLRIDSAISLLMEEIKKVRKTSFTVAPEAGSQKLRDVINKGLTEDQILYSAKEIYEGGWNLLKLYFMIGLPSEEDNDLISIVELSKKISRLGPQGRKGHVLNVSISPFVPKTHTPFEWFPQLTLEEGRRRINFIRERLQSHRVKVKWNSPEASWLEGIFSRGDRRLTKVIVEAWQQGARFDSWSEHLAIDIWKKALKTCKLDPDFYLHRERGHEEILPWDHIDSGITKAFLLSEWQKAMEGKTTPDCRQYCSNCGVCSDNKISPVLFDTEHPLEEKGGILANQSYEQGKRYRICFTKLEKTKYLSHLELIKVFIRAFRRAEIDLVYSSGYHPMPRISFAMALPVGIESLGEIVDIQAKNITDTSLAIKKLNEELPSGIRILSMEEIAIKEPHAKIKESYFYLQANGYFNKEAVDRFLMLKSCLAVKKRRNGEKIVDIRSQVKALYVLSNGALELTVRHGEGPELKPTEIIKNVFTLNDSQIEGISVLKTKSLII